MRAFKFSLSLLSVFFFACISDSPKSIEVEIEKKDSSTNFENIEKINSIKHIFFSLPSPIELTYLFKQEGVEYQRDKLFSTKEKDNYILPREKALILGIYGADLSYAGLFGKHQDAIEYFATVQMIAEDIGVGQTFQKEFILRLERNANSKDTLLQVISEFFIENDNYLKDHERQEISALILLGGWVEGIYLGTEMALDYNAVGIKKILAEQKSSLENMILLLDQIKVSSVSENLLDSLKGLLPHFNQLNEDSLLDDADFLVIKDKISAIRASIIKR